MDKTSLGDRMKNNYENISRYYITRRMPVIIRVDMKAGHTFTKGLKKPFDDIFVKSMQDTMRYLCENIQGCILGYTQSDEISLALTDYTEITTDAWFGNNLQKMCSVSASMATLAFNQAFDHNAMERIDRIIDTSDTTGNATEYTKILLNARAKGAMFDSRVFAIPKEEVCNYFIWRQQDATRNSILSVGQANFGKKELLGESCNNIQDMLMTQKGVNWNDFATTLKRGSCCIKVNYNKVDLIYGCTSRNIWIIDNEIPIFSQDREYIEALV